MNINEYKDKLRKLYPSAIISVEMEEKYVKWELKLYPKISEKEHEDSFNDNTIDMIDLGNDLFRNSQPLTGKELDYLSDCLSKNSPSIAKIKNRL